MRQVDVKLNYNSIVSVSTRDVGFIGEHNATELVIDIPSECISDADCFLLNFNDGQSDIVSHVVTTDTKTDGAWIEDGKIHCVLWQQLTRGQYLSVTVEGYKHKEEKLERLFKLPRIENLRFRPANEGKIEPKDTASGGFVVQMERMMRDAHTHDNKDALDKYGEIDGKPTFNGEEIKVEIPTGLTNEVELNTQARHDHDNIDTLGQLSEKNGILHFAGKALDAEQLHTHPNKPTLDKLTEADGALYLDGKRLGCVTVWHIVDDPVNVPSMADGTLLFVVPGKDGDMNYPPYYVNIIGTPVKKIAPWKPGQLWVCRGGTWFLLATANKTEYTPEEVIPEQALFNETTFTIATNGETEEDVMASAPTTDEVIYDTDPCENVDRSGGIVEVVKTLQTKSHTHSNLEILEKVEATDDVVLLPFGEPLDLYLRADFLNLQYPNHRYFKGLGIEVKADGGRYIGVYAEGNGVMLRYYDGEITTESYNGFEWNNGSSIQPVDEPITDFSIDSISYFDGVDYVAFDSAEAIKEDNYAKFIYRLFCQIFNTSPENMGSIDIIDNAIESNIATGLKWGRTYDITVTGNSYELVFDNSAELPIDILGLENDAYCVVYLTLEQDCDIAHEATFLVNGEAPNTCAGCHKWIFNRLPDGTISLGSLDLEAIV